MASMASEDRHLSLDPRSAIRVVTEPDGIAAKSRSCRTRQVVLGRDERGLPIARWSLPLTTDTGLVVALELDPHLARRAIRDDDAPPIRLTGVRPPDLHVAVAPVGIAGAILKRNRRGDVVRCPGTRTAGRIGIEAIATRAGTGRDQPRYGRRVLGAGMEGMSRADMRRRGREGGSSAGKCKQHYDCAYACEYGASSDGERGGVEHVLILSSLLP